MNKRYFIFSFLAILLLIVAVAGWFAKDYLGNKAREEIIGESRASVLTLSIYLTSTFTHMEGAVKSLAGSPWIAPALIFKRDQDIEQANSVLDRYNSALNASVSYLMDADGLTVASSNRKDPDTFVGKSYRFRPYFQEAAKGQAGRYFALGVTSGKRGFYANYPVQNRLGQVLGVVTMKKDLDEMETFFRNYPFCFLINRDGIIFLSSTPEMVLKSFWPLDKVTQEKLMASKQFGNKPFQAVINREIGDGTEVALGGKEYFVSRRVIGGDGWSIVLLTPSGRIWIYKLIGILATIIVCFLIVVFGGILYFTNRSLEAVRQSEESKRLLLHAAGDGIFGVDIKGQTTFVNPAALRMLGFAEAEMLGQSVHALIHHSYKDGSNYPVEDCPMYASHTKATENRVAEEVLWRKDGRSFPVEYFSTPIIRDGRGMGAVVVFKDITERKQAEEALHRSEERYRIIIEQMEDGYFEIDLSGNFTFVNDAECRNLGYTREELIGMNNRQYIDEKNLKELVNLFTEVNRTGIPIKAYALELFKKDGTRAYNEISVSLIKDAKGKPIGFRGISRDVTERKQAEEALFESEARYRAVAQSANDAIITADSDGIIVSWNRGAEKMFGYTEAEIRGQSLNRLIPQRLREQHVAGMKRVQTGGDHHVIGKTVELEGIRKDMSEFPIELSLAQWETVEGRFYTAILRDITERKSYQENLEYSAIHDSLTGLLNRRSLEDMLNRSIARAKRGTISSLLYLDLDNFKEVNDTVGHNAGDEVLIILTDLIKKELRTEDIVFRLGGDEFAVLFDGMSSREAYSAAERLRLVVVAHPFEQNGQIFPLSLSIGLIQIDGILGAGELLSQADAAMYQAKARGKNRVVVFGSEDKA